MTPDMSVNEMLNSFIYIVKGSRVIDRHDPVDWATARWMPDKFAKSKTYTVGELKRYFSHNCYSKWNGKTVYRFDEWFAHPHRFISLTLFDAITFADSAARGLIDMEAIIKNAEAQAKAAREANVATAPDWVKRYGQAG